MKFTFQVLKNPTKKDLSFYYDSAEYTVKAESEELLPDFIAKIGAKRLADINWSDKLDLAGRNKYIASLLGSTKEPVADVPTPSLQEEIKEQTEAVKEEEETFKDLDELNKGEVSREDLKAQAKEKGLEFPANIPTDKLVKMLEE